MKKTRRRPVGRPRELGDDPIRFACWLSRAQHAWLEREADRRGRWRSDGARSMADVLRGLIDREMGA